MKILDKKYKTKTKKISLEGENLTSLPDELSNLLKLKKLYLRYNNITSLPESNFKNLRHLYLCQTI